MTDKEKKNQIADILLDFYDEYDSNVINRPMIPSIYAGKILDFMQEEPVSEGLEEAAKHNTFKYVFDKNVKEALISELKYIGDNSFKDGAKWQEKKDQSTIKLAEDHAMLAGIEKMKQQMMKDAVDGVVEYKYSRSGKNLFDVGSRMLLDAAKYHVNDGGKVKLIIIKEG